MLLIRKRWEIDLRLDTAYVIRDSFILLWAHRDPIVFIGISFLKIEVAFVGILVFFIHVLLADLTLRIVEDGVAIFWQLLCGEVLGAVILRKRFKAFVVDDLHLVNVLRLWHLQVLLADLLVFWLFVILELLRFFLGLNGGLWILFCLWDLWSGFTT